jgi:hypothetical protein
MPCVTWSDGNAAPPQPPRLIRCQNLCSLIGVCVCVCVCLVCDKDPRLSSRFFDFKRLPVCLAQA